VQAQAQGRTLAMSFVGYDGPNIVVTFVRADTQRVDTQVFTAQANGIVDPMTVPALFLLSMATVGGAPIVAGSASLVRGSGYWPTFVTPAKADDTTAPAPPADVTSPVLPLILVGTDNAIGPFFLMPEVVGTANTVIDLRRTSPAMSIDGRYLGPSDVNTSLRTFDQLFLLTQL